MKDFNSTSSCAGASLVAQTLKNPPAVQGTRVWSPDWDNPLEKGMAAHSSILAWRMPWTEESGGLQSTSSQTFGHDWVTNTYFMLNIRVYPDSIKVSDLKNIVKLFICFVLSFILWPQSTTTNHSWYKATENRFKDQDTPIARLKISGSGIWNWGWSSGFWMNYGVHGTVHVLSQIWTGEWPLGPWRNKVFDFITTKIPPQLQC